MLRAFNAMESGVGLQRDATDLRIQFLQAAGGSDESPGGAEHGHEMRDASFSLLPDFVCRGFVMRAPVGLVRILVGVEIKIRMALRILAGNFDGAIGAFGGVGVDDLCAVCL